MRILFLCMFLLVLMGCYDQSPEEPMRIVSGYRPVYTDRAAGEIRLLTAQTVSNPGKIYRYGNLLFINEINRGIHVYDNTDRANPLPIAFMEILGNSDIAIKDSVFYVDHMGNLAALKTNQFTSVQQIGSLPIQGWLLGVPPPAGFYFECVDGDNGLVSSWQQAMLTNPDCYAFERGW